MKKIIVVLIALGIFAIWIYSANFGEVMVFAVLPMIALIIVWNILKYLVSTDNAKLSIDGVRNWSNRHINWSWCLLYIVVVLLSFSMLKVVVDRPPVTHYVSSVHSTLIPDEDSYRYVDIPVKTLEKDDESTNNRNKVESVLWFYPVYWIGSFKATKWALDAKHISIPGTWILALIFPFIVLLVDRREK